MIDFIKGVLQVSGPEAVVALGDGSVGLQVRLSERSAAQLPTVGQSVHLWTHLQVREDAWLLFGFMSQQERAMFRLLITVSGIGPKVALGVLSGASAGQLARSLGTGDEKGLARLPGIGRKTAARLVVELGQKVAKEWEGVAVEDGDQASASIGDPDLEAAVAVLSALGLSAGQAEKALLKAKQTDREIAGDLNEWVRAALVTLPGGGVHPRGGK